MASIPLNILCLSALPKKAVNLRDPINVKLMVETDQWFEAGDILFEWTGPTLAANKKRLETAIQPYSTKGFEDDPSITKSPYSTIQERVGPRSC